MHISNQMVRNTVRFEGRLPDGSTSVGTCFGFNFSVNGNDVPTLVTNKHVVRGVTSANLKFTETEDGQNPKGAQQLSVEVPGFEDKWVPHPDDNTDLVIIPSAGILATLGQRKPLLISANAGLIPTRQEFECLKAVEDIYMVGYPDGLWDAHNNLPIVRRGITATPVSADHNGRRTFLVDCACFPGSSGSPIFLLNDGISSSNSGEISLGETKFKLLGVLFAGPMHTRPGQISDVENYTKKIALTDVPMNLGYCIRSDCLQGFEPILEKLIQLEKRGPLSGMPDGL